MQEIFRNSNVVFREGDERSGWSGEIRLTARASCLNGVVATLNIFVNTLLEVVSVFLTGKAVVVFILVVFIVIRRQRQEGGMLKMR